MIALMLALALSAGQLAAGPISTIAKAPSVANIVVERARAHQVNPGEMVSLALCESSLNPNAVGDHGTSFGVFQLHRGGLLAVFYADGYSDPFDAWQASDFTAGQIAGGNAREWSCWWTLRGLGGGT